MIDESRPFLLSIKDPNDLSNDVAKSSFGILLVREAFAYAFYTLSHAGEQKSHSLQHILGIDAEMISKRL